MEKFKIHSVETVSEVSQKSKVKIVTYLKRKTRSKGKIKKNITAQVLNSKRQMRAVGNRLSNKTTQEQQKQSRLKTQLLFFEKTGSTSKHNCYELKLPNKFLYFSLATCH